MLSPTAEAVTKVNTSAAAQMARGNISSYKHASIATRSSAAVESFLLMPFTSECTLQCPAGNSPAWTLELLLLHRLSIIFWVKLGTVDSTALMLLKHHRLFLCLFNRWGGLAAIYCCDNERAGAAIFTLPLFSLFQQQTRVNIIQTIGGRYIGRRWKETEFTPENSFQGVKKKVSRTSTIDVVPHHILSVAAADGCCLARFIAWQLQTK